MTQILIREPHSEQQTHVLSMKRHAVSVWWCFAHRSTIDSRRPEHASHQRLLNTTLETRDHHTIQEGEDANKRESDRSKKEAVALLT